MLITVRYLTPIVSQDYVADINKVLDIIKSYDLEFNVGILSTTIRRNKLYMLTNLQMGF